ncbi:hypothetical protein KPH14_010352 [Odynerus spinipes]|uniref:Queuine tRNA-ribosyltransferase accessory subunit 2 n=1 Tax=Odynerus spinipes TaxID=1348599 RepID=A0AAD9RV18_9HYME|nr:hypothetical protein KPH14_010352 [Odynerus spinipes]
MRISDPLQTTTDWLLLNNNIMKFFVNSLTRCAPRVGKLTEFERSPDVLFETPLVLMYTKRGCVPHLTKDVLKRVTTQCHLLSISLPSTITMEETLKELNVNFAEFVSMKEYLNFLSIQDPAETTPSGFQQNDAVSIWSRTGRTLLTANKYMDLVETFRPDLYVALCDGDTDINSTSKRIIKATSRSKTLIEQCIKRHNASDKLKSKGILGAVEGGYDLKTREQSVKYLKDKPLAGYVIDGLHNNGPNVRSIPWEQVENVVQHTINLLPVDKLRVSLGCWHPLVTLELINLGVDILDSTYAYIATERSEALIFMCDHGCCKSIGHTLVIGEKRYADDFSPICQRCECLACKHHTRAYLHHLHVTKELLGMVLLTIHNTHHYLEFFNAIRKNIKSATFDQFREKLKSKFSNEDL